MEAIKKRLKTSAVLLSSLLLFQNCVVYHKMPTTLDKAAAERTRAKVTNRNGVTFVYNHISVEQGQYYGMKLKKGDWVRTPLDPNMLGQVKTKNKSASTWLTVGLIPVAILGALLVLYAADDEVFVSDLSE